MAAGVVNSVSLWPGSVAGAWAFRRELARFSRSLPAIWIRRFVIVTGGVLTVYYFVKTV